MINVSTASVFLPMTKRLLSSRMMRTTNRMTTMTTINTTTMRSTRTSRTSCMIRALGTTTTSSSYYLHYNDNRMLRYKSPIAHRRSVGGSTVAGGDAGDVFAISESSLWTRRRRYYHSSTLPDTSSATLRAPISSSLVVKKRLFSTASPSEQYHSIRILYASQGGTAQLFAMQLMEELEEQYETRYGGGHNTEITMSAWNEYDNPADVLDNKQGTGDDAVGTTTALHIFICSTTGVGEPPDNGRDFYNYIMSANNNDDMMVIKNVPFAMFGLGNSKAHPNHYNSVSKHLYQTFLDRKAKPVLPLGLGDDGDCIEDDFDQFQEHIIQYLFTTPAATNEQEEEEKGQEASQKDEDGPQANQEKQKQQDMNATVMDASASVAAATTTTRTNETLGLCPGGALAPCGTRRISSKYRQLELVAPETERVRTLLPLDSGLYPHDSQVWHVVSNHCLNSDPVANGMWEIQLEPTSVDRDPNDDKEDNKLPLYEAGDHLLISSRNLDCVVEGYMYQVLDDVKPHAVIKGVLPKDGVEDSDSSSITTAYPYPLGISVYETLSHCIDLGATPSPSWCKKFLGKDVMETLDYKQDIAMTRRTALDLLLQYGKKISLEDFLYTSTPLHGRHYSIASSHMVHPDKIYLLYRPVQYVTNRGVLREGVCTSYLKQLNASSNSRIVAHVNRNPTFRLPGDPFTPIAFMAGGCGTAPIRAFVEHRIEMRRRGVECGEAMLFLGFRNPADEVYKDMIQEAKDIGAITESYVTYTTGCPSNRCGLITDAVEEHGQRVYNLVHNEKAHLYLCGGARTFGAAIGRVIHKLYEKCGNCNEEQATVAMRALTNSGRLHEDLAD